MENKGPEYINYGIPDLPWKDFDSLILAVGNGEIQKREELNTDTKFLRDIDFLRIVPMPVPDDSGHSIEGDRKDFFSGMFFEPRKNNEIMLSLTPRGLEYYTQKFVRNNQAGAKHILSEALKLHPAVILISQVLSGCKSINRMNVYNLLKHHEFQLDFQKDVELNNFLEILKLGSIISYNKHTRDVRILWEQDTETLSSHQFVSPETPYSNLKRLREIIKSLKGTVYWIDKHFDKKAFDVLIDSLDATRITNFIIISGEANKTQSAVNEFLRLKSELHSKGTIVEWKIITDQSTLSSFHDRWLCDSNSAWNVPPINSIFKGQESEMLKTTNRPNINKLSKISVSVK
jgi:hypothetical protein